MEETIDEKKFSLTWKVAIPIMASLLIISNTFTLQISEIEQNAKDNIRIEEAGKRRLKNAMEKHELQQEVIFYKFQLKECNETNR